MIVHYVETHGYLKEIEFWEVDLWFSDQFDSYHPIFNLNYDYSVPLLF